MSEHRLAVTIVGYGAVGRALTLALHKAGARIVQIAEHEDSERIRLAQEEGFRVFPLHMVETDVDLIVLAVGDSQIETVARELCESLDTNSARNHDPSDAVPEKGKPVVMHLSGGTGLEVLSPLGEMGFPVLAWHPIQTFPAMAEPERFRGIFIGMTGDDTGLALGEHLASLVGAKSMVVPNELRARYHLASVLASNFMPMLLEMGAQRFAGIAPTMQDAWQALLPLVRGMVDNMEQMGPAGAMTGPVTRDDLRTVLAHLGTFSNPEEEELYRSLIHGLLSLAVRSGRMTPERSKAWYEALGPQGSRN